MFERDVLINGTVYNSHRVGAIWHALGDASTVIVQSVEGDVFDANWIETQYRHNLNWSLSPSEAESWVMALDEFAEYIDPSAEETQQLQTLVDTIADMLTDEQAASVPDAYKAWNDSESYEAGQRVSYEGAVYKCLQAHSAQTDWMPTAAPSLWASVIASDDPGNPAEWVQPDSTNAYGKGDRVTFEGQVYESLIDNNVWSPSAYPQGWQQI